MTRPVPLVLRDGDRARLEAIADDGGGLGCRARIVLLAAEGLPSGEIARRVSASRPTVLEWRARYEQGGIPALRDRPRSGRPRQIDAAPVLAATLARTGRPPAETGASRWTARLLGTELGVPPATVARIWRQRQLSPGEIESFRFATEPVLEVRARDVLGVHLNPPDRVVVLVPAGTRPAQPARPGIPPAGHDCVRQVTAALTAAASGPRNPAAPTRDPQLLIRFLTRVAAAQPRWRLEVVLAGTGELPSPVRSWLAGHPNVVPHVSTGCWVELTQILLGAAACQVRHRGGPAALDALADAVRAVERRGSGSAFTWIRTETPTGRAA